MKYLILMSNLYEIRNAIKQANWSLKHNAIATDLIKTSAIYKYLSRGNEILQIKPIIFCINCNKLNPLKFQELQDLIDEIRPDLAWIMEIWGQPPCFLGYNAFNDGSMQTNVLYVKSNVVRNRIVQKIPFGFRIEDLNFRYIPPRTSKRVELLANEFGDLNFASNPWINKKNFYQEFGRRTGMGFSTIYSNFPRFFRVKSDHNAFVVQISSIWIKKLRNDRFKLENEINSLYRKTKLGYIFKNTDNYTYPKCNNDKIVNPIVNNLDLKPWMDLYKHGPKPNNENYKPICSDGKLHKISSHAYDVNNISNKMVIDILYNKNNSLIQKFIEANDGKFSSKTICLKKKDKIPDSVLNLRPVQVSPINFKLAEQSRGKLKDWLIKNTDARILSFLPGKSTEDMFKALRQYILNNT